MESTNELMQQRIDKIQDFRDHGIEPYPYRYDPDTTAEQVLATHSETTNEPNLDKKVRVAGRIITKRDHGLSLIHI